MCFSDSKVSLFWIKGTNHEWKQFVENRVSNIRSLVQPQHWKHCPGAENPADIPSKGMAASTLAETPLWLRGPHWLCSEECQPEESDPDTSAAQLPDDCRIEMKRKDLTHSFVAVDNTGPNLSQLITPEDYSSAHRLFRVTALVLVFVHNVRNRVHNPSATDGTTTLSELEQARLLWLKEILQNDARFPSWKAQLGLTLDNSGVWRCVGRMMNANLSLSAQTPILLDKNHHLTKLIVMDAHRRVMHNGIQETLAELKSSYWVIRGRQFVCKLIHGCTICRKIEEDHSAAVPTPPLPEYRVRQSRPFQTTGVDFAGPLHVKTSDHSRTSKVWLCLYTCCITRAVHLELVSDLSTPTFMRCLNSQTRDTLQDDI